jgi:23S rRNA (adenine2030-N6)-methyltransferase
MNYRHAFHAGNFADVFKHALLARILIYLMRKDAPLRYIDTHAGNGRYDLRANLAERTGEWRGGIGCFGKPGLPRPVAELLEPWLAAVGPLDAEGRPASYPGSPALAQALLRAQDRLTLCELHPEDMRLLVKRMGRDARLRIVELDGYLALNAFVPPPERRGLVLVDPPFEARDEFSRMAATFATAFRKWPTGTYAFWYPLKDRRASEDFARSIRAAGADKLLRMEFWVDAISAEGPLAGSGLLVVNPPFVLEKEARILLPAFVRLMAQGPGAGWRVEG